MLTVGVLVAAALLLSLHWRVSAVAERQAEVEQTLKPKVRTMTTTYVDSTGVTRSVTTTRNANETIREWADRHADDVVAMMEQYPPAEPPE